MSRVARYAAVALILGLAVVLTLALIIFAVHVPTLIGFTVARFAEAE